MKTWLIVGLCVLLAGAILFTCGLAAAGWDIRRLSTDPVFTEKEQIFENRDQTVRIKDQNMPVVVGRSPDNAIHLTRYENEKEFYVISEGDHLQITKQTDYKWYDRIFNIQLQRPVLTLLLPEGYSGDLQIQTTNGSIEVKALAGGRLALESGNGAIKLENLQLDSLSAVTSNAGISAKSVTLHEAGTLTTSNGKIEMQSVSAGRLIAVSTNAAMALTGVRTEGSLSLTTSNGALRLSDLSCGGDIGLKTSNASIKGNILGGMSDFTISSKTSNAANNLPESAAMGEQKLEVQTSNGEIRIRFDGSDGE